MPGPATESTAPQGPVGPPTGTDPGGAGGAEAPPTGGTTTPTGTEPGGTGTDPGGGTPPRTDPPTPPASGPRIPIDPASALDRLFGITDRLDALNLGIAGTDSREAIRTQLAAGGGRTGELLAAMDAARDTLEAIMDTPGIPSSVRAQAAFEVAGILRATPGIARDRIRSFYERATQLEPGSSLFRQALQDFISGSDE